MKYLKRFSNNNQMFRKLKNCDEIPEVSAKLQKLSTQNISKKFCKLVFLFLFRPEHNKHFFFSRLPRLNSLFWLWLSFRVLCFIWLRCLWIPRAERASSATFFISRKREITSLRSSHCRRACSQRQVQVPEITSICIRSVRKLLSLGEKGLKLPNLHKTPKQRVRFAHSHTKTHQNWRDPVL